MGKEFILRQVKIIFVLGIIFLSLILLASCKNTANTYNHLISFSELPHGPSDKILRWKELVQRSDILVRTQYSSDVFGLNYDSIKNVEFLTMLSVVNTVVNSIDYVADKQNYDVLDYWASPDEFFINGGDCEDYAIAKYFILKEFGISPSNMRLTVVFDLKLNSYHAILLVKNVKTGVWFSLDNQTDRIHVTNDDYVVTKYILLYQMNELHYWK